MSGLRQGWDLDWNVDGRRGQDGEVATTAADMENSRKQRKQRLLIFCCWV